MLKLKSVKPVDLMLLHFKCLPVTALLCAIGLFLGIAVAQVPYAQPPSPLAEQQQCDPIRHRIIQLNQKPAWLAPFYQPRIASLKRQYARCFQAIQKQEFDYLKQVTIPGHPGSKLPEAKPLPSKKWFSRR